MSNENALYHLWVNWDESVASFSPTPGYDALSFCTTENYQANLYILIQSGFCIQ